MEARAREALQRGMAQLADGERAAFPAVFAALWPALRAFAERLLGDAALAEDAAQSALVRVFARASEFDPERDALAWAFGVVAFECRTLRKTSLRRREQPLVPGELPGRASADASPEDQASRRQLAEAAAAVIGDLRPADAEVLLQLASGERPAVSSTTFRKRVERALSRLRAAWRARHGSD